MIYYTEFSVDPIFQDPRLNVFYNQLYTSLINIFKKIDVAQELVIDGMVALLLQEETPSAKFNKLEISINNREIFNYIKNNSRTLPLKKVQTSDNTIILFLESNHVIYINYVFEDLLKVNYKGIFIRNKSQIL